MQCVARQWRTPSIMQSRSNALFSAFLCRPGLPAWQREPFAAMSRNSAKMSDYLKVPNDRLVEIGRQIPV
ncbi:KUP/HAK/KT family potassium transporter [Mesorhizobium sp. AR07]|uniref:KUP/HAK/KT family potassium transporter n=1 Tax=Mesorhizobium sp. AR07 TaxID=2865838 RepID=UPI0039B6FE36